MPRREANIMGAAVGTNDYDLGGQSGIFLSLFADIAGPGPARCGTSTLRGRRR